MNTTAAQAVSRETLKGAYSYAEYRTMIDKLLEQDKTTGDNHSEAMVNYTRMNVQRMNRLDKSVELNASLLDSLNEVSGQWIWLVLTEAWCGDAAQNIPAVVKMAEQSDRIDIRFILRDENLDIMDEYLTNGGRSIPKLLCLDAESLEVGGTWGPRPQVIQEKAMEWKEDNQISKKEWAERLHKWYAKNKTHELQREFERLVNNWQDNCS